MSAIPSESAPSAEVDSGLACLVMLARFHNVSACAEQLTHSFAEDGRAFATPELLLAAKQLGLKAQRVRSRVARLARLTAPVDGTVQQLAIHTQGGVVTEALLENKDIGFVRAGQAVEIKVETFTKYGVIDGTVLSISSDAIEDEKLGLVYSARIQLKQNSIQVGANRIELSPGMAVRAEVKTDKRKVIDYFLSPLKEYQDESLKER